MRYTKTVITICGPTAVGKTALAIQLAQHYKTQIVSADSRQCYKELNIGVAKPSVEELATVRHHFINVHSVTDEVNAATFEQYALTAVEQIFEGNDTAIMVGGTGLYLKAFCDGLDEMPVVSKEVREEIVRQYKIGGLNWLQNEVQNIDPAFWLIAEQQNPQRLLRALEVKLSTGRSVNEFRTGNKVERNFHIIKLGLEMPKPALHHNINIRVDRMIADGLLDEVKSLVPYKQLNALQTVGYKELFDYLAGFTSLADSIERIKINTRQYAKRQITWFKKDADVSWYNGSQYLGNKIMAEIDKRFNQ